MSNGQSTGLAPVSWREFGLVIIFGGIGGFLSWIYIITVGQPLPQTWWKAILASIALGMGAGFIGVYVIANSDTRALFRCLGFALLCGFSWKPVYDAGGALIKQTTTRQAEQQVLSLSKTSEKLALDLSKAPPELLPSKINETTKTTIDLLRALPKVDNPNIRSEVQSRAHEAVTAIKNVTTQNPEEAVKALTEIGTVAVETKEPQIANLTIQSLGAIGVEAKESKRIVPIVYRSLGDIAKVAEVKGSPKLAIESRYEGAQTVLTAAKNAKKKGDVNALWAIPLKDAKKDFVAVKMFYESIEDLDKAKKIETQSGELTKIITGVPQKSPKGVP